MNLIQTSVTKLRTEGQSRFCWINLSLIFFFSGRKVSGVHRRRYLEVKGDYILRSYLIEKETVGEPSQCVCI